MTNNQHNKRQSSRQVAEMKIVFFWIISTLIVVGFADDVPCQPRPGDDGKGFICVCNSTYCDTLERPATLSSGQFHWYSTSNSTPGFTHTTGTFSQFPPTEDHDVVIKVNASVVFQEILGFGGSFTDSAGLAFKSLPEGAQEKLLESYFGPQGIEYTFGRVPIGSSDFSLKAYTLDDVPFDENLQSFNLSYEDYHYKIPMIQQAISLSSADRPIKFMGCSWLAPSWMKDNNGRLCSYIRHKYLRTFAEYHLKFVEAYKENGIDIWSLSGGNEVVLFFFLPPNQISLNSTLMSAPIQGTWFRDHLRPVLKASNFSDVKILSMEDQRIFTPYWMKRFADDPASLAAMDGLALHFYFDSFSPPSLMDDYHNQFPDKLLLYTETSINFAFGGGGKVVQLGSWFHSELYTFDIVENLLHWVQSYTDWNLCLNLDGGPALVTPVDAAIIVNATSGEFYKQPIFYGMGHFSKFMPPGSRRIWTETDQNKTSNTERLLQSGLSAEEMKSFVKTGSYTPSGGSGSGAPIPITILIPPTVTGVATSNPDGSYTVIVLSSMNVTTHVRIEDARVGTISVDVEPSSINSFIYWVD